MYMRPGVCVCVKNLHLSMVPFSIGVPYTTLEGFPVLC